MLARAVSMMRELCPYNPDDTGRKLNGGNMNVSFVEAKHAHARGKVWNIG